MDICSHKLKEWWEKGDNMFLLDLRRDAYPQVPVAFSDYAPENRLTWLGFGLNVVPLIMRSILDTVLSQDDSIGRAILSYINDIYINESMFSAKQLGKHLADQTYLQSLWETCGWGQSAGCTGRGGGVAWHASTETRSQKFYASSLVFSHYAGNLRVIFQFVVGWVVTAFLKWCMYAVTNRWDRL